MRKLLLSAMFAASTLGLGITQSNAIEINKPKGVVELFTSQGCYSCPPADKLVGEYAKGKDVLALSWHVDYWDYLGWKDIFASPENTQRQYSYARALRERQVYTPQAVINGRTHAVGSNKREINKLLKLMQESNRGMTVPIDVIVSGESMKIAVANSEQANDATLYMVFFNKEHEVKIKRGENGGKTLSYHNVVHSSQALGMIKASGFQTEFPMVEMKKRGFDGSALILQKNDSQGNPSAIIGATVITGL